MDYKGYHARVEFDDESEVFHGEVVDLRDVITFEAATVDDLKSAFRESVDDYLEFCRERGEDPDRPYSGRFIIRIDPDLHRAVDLCAKFSEMSLNSWVTLTLRDAINDTENLALVEKQKA